MTQINYDRRGFYRFNFDTKEDERIKIEELPTNFNPGDRVYLDYENANGVRVHLIFDRKTSRDDLVKICKRCYNPPKKAN